MTTGSGNVQTASSINKDVAQFCQNVYVDPRDPLVQNLRATDWDSRAAPTQVSNFPAEVVTESTFGRELHAISHPGENFISLTQRWRSLQLDLFHGRVRAMAEVPFGSMASEEAREKDVREMFAVINQLLGSRVWERLNDLLADGTVAFIFANSSKMMRVDIYPQSSGEEAEIDGTRPPRPIGGGVVLDLEDISSWEKAFKVQ
jgi:hypothetical protein